MNREQINALRASMNLPPFVPTPAEVAAARARKRAQDANRAARAQANRDMKSKRGTRSKAK
jgi:hypothetical protein